MGSFNFIINISFNDHLTIYVYIIVDKIALKPAKR